MARRGPPGHASSARCNSTGCAAFDTDQIAADPRPRLILGQVSNLTYRSGQLRRPLFSDDEAASVAHERVVSVDLAGESRPATREVFQNLGFSFALR
jgi:hypothetical protein